MDSSSSHSPSFAHFQLPHPHPCSHSHSQSYPTIPVSDIPLETYLPRCVLRGSLDPTTGIFYRAPEHTRIRTAQACDKCRVRKAKCSGDHPVCERCHTRGLTCRYAPERRTRRWSKAKAEQDAVPLPNRSTGRSGFVPQSPDAFQPARPRSGPWGTSTSHRPSSRDADTNRPRSGNGNDQRSGAMTPGGRPRRATIAPAEVHSLSSSSISQQVPGPWRGGPDRPRQGCGHPVSGLPNSVPVRASAAHEELETTEESMVFGGGDGEGTLEGDLDLDLDLDTPRVGQNALALCLDPYTGDPPAFIESILTPEATGDDMSRVTLADHDPAYTNSGLIGPEYPEGVDGAQYPILFHHSHRSGPGPGSCFDPSSVDRGTLMSDDGTPSLCCASNAESPGRTPSTSSFASPVFTRARSDELPMTPTNSYPNSPVLLASLSPRLGFVDDPNARPLITSEVWTMDMGTDGHHYHHHHGGGSMLTEHVGWREVKDSAHSFWGDLGLFIDMDAVF